MQQPRLADGLGSVGHDLTRMADADEGGGITGDLVRRVADHASTIGSWLGERDPQQLVQEVTSFARRRPGTFIAVAAIAGIVVGRLSRAIASGAASGASESSASSRPEAPRFAEADARARAAEQTPSATRVDAQAGSFPAPPIPGEPRDAHATNLGEVEPGVSGDDTGLVPGADGGDPPLYTEAIRADIERTRAELGSDVDALADKVSPSKIVQRQKGKVHGAVRSVRDRLMGVADDAGSAASDLAHHAGDAAHGATDKAKGNPLAVGLVAFGAGLVLASLIPPSRAERDAAAKAKDSAAPLVEQAKDVPREVVDDLKEPASDAAAALKDRAAEAVEHVKDDSTEAAGAVRDRAQEAGESVRDA